jgi:hypothetical protein
MGIMRNVPLSTLRSRSYDLMSALDDQMDLEKLPPNPPQPPDKPWTPPHLPLATKEQKIQWLMANPEFLKISEDTVIEALVLAGLLSKKTNRCDINLEPLIKEASRRLNR